MTRLPVPEALTTGRVVAVLRGGTGRHLEAVASTLLDAGVRCLEITTNTTGYAEVLPRLVEKYDDAVALGLGTVRTAEHVASAVQLGLDFVVAPNLDPDVGRAAAVAGICWIPGAMTPTEIAQAWRLGASAVKVFPAAQAGGPSYLAAVRAPLDEIPLIPTGGIDAGDAAAYLRAGAVALGVGSPLVGDALDTGETDALARRARELVAAVAGGGR